MKRIAVIGAGGFAREVAWLIRDLNRVTHQFEFLGFLVSDMSLLLTAGTTKKSVETNCFR